MAGFLILLALTAIWMFGLITESKTLNRRINQIPLRITVSGTRGKTSIVRTLASVFRENGITVLAKTTGSEAMYILPDGTTERISRKGQTTILEQKKLIRKASQLKVKCIITEIMSIHPENHTIETNKLIRPGITILSNFRADHTDVAGESPEEISELFLHDIFPASTVFIPEMEINDFIRKGIENRGAELIPASENMCGTLDSIEELLAVHIAENLDAVYAVSKHLGISKEQIEQGIRSTQLDIGQATLFRWNENGRKVYFVNAFAANDPVSTRQIIRKTISVLAPEMDENPEIIALLSLRTDRGERSRQWLNYLLRDGSDLFHRIYVSGIHSPIFSRKLNNCETLNSSNPEKITRQILESSTGNLIVFGIANIHGPGMDLLNYWKTI